MASNCFPKYSIDDLIRELTLNHFNLTIKILEKKNEYDSNTDRAFLLEPKNYIIKFAEGFINKCIDDKKLDMKKKDYIDTIFFYEFTYDYIKKETGKEYTPHEISGLIDESERVLDSVMNGDDMEKDDMKNAVLLLKAIKYGIRLDSLI